MKTKQALKLTQKQRSLSKAKGQAVLEYVLMMALLSTISLGFAAFFNNVVFGSGIQRLPAKASQCMSHPTGRGGSSGCN